MTSQDASNRLQFLWNASHTFLSTVPSLSAFYMQQFNQFSAEKELSLAEAVKRKYCSYCGSIFLPGINSQVRIEKNKKRKGNKKKNSDLDLVGQPKGKPLLFFYIFSQINFNQLVYYRIECN